MKNLLFLSLLFIGVMGMVSCEGPVGPIGPAGPAGAQGATGEQGPAGNANVKTKLVTVNPNDWQVSGVDLVYDINAAEITADIEATGLVYGFVRAAGDDWQTLPFIIPYDTYFSTLTFSHSVGNIRAMIYDSDGLTPLDLTVALEFKFVIIASGGKIAGVNHNDYEEVMTAYNLD